MTSLYAMRRANGDWFAVNDQGRLRVPVYRSSIEAWQGHWRNSEMALFKPVVLDERALKDLAHQGATNFWLVEEPLADPSDGVALEYAQLVQLVQGGKQTEPRPESRSKEPAPRPFFKMTTLIAARK